MRRKAFAKVLCLLLMLPVLGIMANAGATRYMGVTLYRSDYDYAPSVMIGDGPLIKMWWGGGTGSGDGIYYSRLTPTGWESPRLVFTRSSSGWDSRHVCDPSVIKGSFTFNGVNYSYAMYYTATYDNIGYDSHIGVAFSNDGVNWVRYGPPIISPHGDATPPTKQYGAGMCTVYNDNGTIIMIYFDSTLGGNYMVTSTDGINFGNRQKVPHPRSWEHIGDIAYSSSEGKWYICTKHGNDQEIYIYETENSSLMSTWRHTGGISSLTTGNVKNHNPGFLRDPYGNIYFEANTEYIYVYYGTGSTSPSTWNIGQSIYVRGWEFEVEGNREGWTTKNLMYDYGPCSGGSWVVYTHMLDPYFESPAIELPAENNRYIKVNIANQNTRTDGKIYFKTAQENYYDESKTVTFTCTNGGGWWTHTIDMSVNPKYTGTITGIRIDPVSEGNGAPLGIAFVRFSSTA